MDFDELEWFSEPTPTSEEDIRRVEENLPYQFPEDYRAFARLGSGGELSATDFSFNDGGDTFEAALGVFLNFTPDDEYSILHVMQSQEFFPNGLVPFAEASGGDWVCFDYRGESGPTIVYWHHGRDPHQDTSHICHTFTAFLELLEEPNDEEE